MMACFPNNPDGPRLYGVTVESDQVMTPYFLHFTFPVMVQHGEMTFVLEQIRRCWGYLLGQGYTTWPEVFDPRWSHCHHWTATPTWLMTRCLLGLTPAFDRGYGHFEWSFEPANEHQASGSIPFPLLDGSPAKALEIAWQKMDDKCYAFRITTPIPVIISVPGGDCLSIASSATFEATLAQSQPHWRLCQQRDDLGEIFKEISNES